MWRRLAARRVLTIQARMQWSRCRARFQLRNTPHHTYYKQHIVYIYYIRRTCNKHDIVQSNQRISLHVGTQEGAEAHTHQVAVEAMAGKGSKQQRGEMQRRSGAEGDVTGRGRRSLRCAGLARRWWAAGTCSDCYGFAVEEERGGIYNEKADETAAPVTPASV